MTVLTFNLTGDGAANQETPTVTMNAGERLRIRFSQTRGASSAKLKLVANGVTSEIDIFNYGDTGEAMDAWVSDNFADGDVVSLVVELGGSTGAKVSGVMETF